MFVFQSQSINWYKLFYQLKKSKYNLIPIKHELGFSASFSHPGLQKMDLGGRVGAWAPKFF